MTEMDNKARIRRYKGLLNTITIICILIGCFIHIGGAIGRDIWNSVFNRNTPVVSGDLKSASNSTGSFTNIDADLDLGDIVITKGSEYKVDYSGFADDLIPVIKNENGTIKIQQKTKGFNWSPWNKNTLSAGKIRITVPEDSKVSLDVDLDLGSFTAEDISLDTADIDANMGSIDLKNCAIYKLDADADMGSITLKNSSLKKGTIDANMGSIDVDGEISDLEANCDMGSITIKSSNDESEMSLDLETDMGSITVNGKELGRKYSSH